MLYKCRAHLKFEGAVQLPPCNLFSFFLSLSREQYKDWWWGNYINKSLREYVFLLFLIVSGTAGDMDTILCWPQYGVCFNSLVR